MIKTFSTIILTIFTLAQTSCKKAPTASFSTDKDEYIDGEVIILTNTSINSYSYKWLATGLQNEITTKDAQVKTNGAGVYNISLKVYSKNGKKQDEVTKSFNVKKASGQALLYTLNSNSLPIIVMIDNVSVGSILQSYIATPNCGDPGCITVNLDEGEHNFTIISNGFTIPFKAIVNSNTCNKIKLF
jgi:hypothetical protein